LTPNSTPRSSTGRQTLHLDQLHRMVRMWRRQALMTERDPEGHRRMLATAAEVQRSGTPRPGSVPWRVLKADLVQRSRLRHAPRAWCWATA
jgi:hypothetical protein